MIDVLCMMTKCGSLSTILLLGLSLLSGGVAARAAALQVTTISDPVGVRITVTPTARAGWGLLQVIDPTTGACLKTLHAGRLSGEEAFAVVPGPALPPGPYQLRYRENVDLVPDGELRRPDSSVPNWLNPADLVLHGSWIYVFDAGQNLPGNPPPQPEDDTPEQRAARLVTQPYVFKMDDQGATDPLFGKNGRLAMPRAYSINAFVIDPLTGRLIMSQVHHNLSVWDPSGTPTKQTIGGWDNNPHGPKCTPWCDAVALGPANRIYIASPSYGHIKVYDRTKNGFDGILYQVDITDGNGYGRMICADGNGAVYLTGASHRVTKYVDDGKSIKPTYQSDPEAKLAVPTGGSASAGLVWFACHGPGFGPFWDSGGGGEVVLFWDTGTELKMIARYGVPGTAADGMEFLNPSAAIMDPAHRTLWVAEDGKANREGPKGNARVRRFQLKAKYTEEIPFELPR